MGAPDPRKAMTARRGGVWFPQTSPLFAHDIARYRVDVIIPALNEQQSLPLVLDALPWEILRHVIVVDNGSTDASAQVARDHGAHVIPEPRRGYGSACLAGLRALSEDPPDVVVFLDADFSDHPEEIERVLAPIACDGAELVIGSRTIGLREQGALLPQALFGNRLASALIALIYGYRFTDLGPFRAVTWAALERIGMQDVDYGWTVEMQVKAARYGLDVVEVPVSYRRRVGVSKITGTLSGSIRAGHKILSTIFLYSLSDAGDREGSP